MAADANVAGQMYPDQSLYPVNSVPALVERINNALSKARSNRVARRARGSALDPPIGCDAEAGFGGALNVFELMKAMIAAGAAGVHFEINAVRKRNAAILAGRY